MPKLILIRGLPGSGKSTMARVFHSFGYQHYEADQYFELNGEYRFNRDDLPKAHEMCLDRTKNALRFGNNVVVANTFSMFWEKQPYLLAAKAIGCDVQILEAQGRWKSVHGVPDEAIKRMADRWERQ